MRAQHDNAQPMLAWPVSQVAHIEDCLPQHETILQCGDVYMPAVDDERAMWYYQDTLVDHIWDTLHAKLLCAKRS